MQGTMDPDPFYHEPYFYHWFAQYNISEWEQWLLDLPNWSITEHWSKLAWVNLYFKCRLHKQYLDYLAIRTYIATRLLVDDEKQHRRYSPY
jgi:hypothetical protein